MSERSITHATFVIERVYDATPERVFAAFANLELKARWFSGPSEWEQDPRKMEFRVGGREHAGGRKTGGPSYTYDAIYQDIVQNERIVYTYEMHMDDVRISVSLATVEIRPEGKGTRLVLTEMGAFLDGHDSVRSREGGTKDFLEKLAKSLHGAGG